MSGPPHGPPHGADGAAADRVESTRIAPGIVQIDTLLGGLTRMTAGYLVEGPSPVLAETEFSLVRFRGDSDKARAPYRGMEPLTGEDIARSAVWALEQPQHVNINRIEIMPSAQAWGPVAVHRE